MNKPKIILELEKELNTEFELVNISEINKSLSFGKSKIAKFSTNKKKNINGLSIVNFKFTNIPQRISDCSDLIELNLSRNLISNLLPLSNLNKLKKLNLNWNKIQDISKLKNLKELENLILSLNEIKNINSLNRLKKIKSLILWNNNISDISVLENLTNLEVLDLWNNNISDIYSLKNLIKLNDIQLGNNNISNFLPLKFKDFKKIDIVISYDSVFINKISLNDFYSIKKETILNELGNKNFIFLLGENGSGKTIFLKALLIALKNHFIQKTSIEETGKIRDVLEQNTDFQPTIELTDKKNSKLKLNLGSVISLENVYAYGTNRNKISKTSAGEEYGFMTLFKDDEFLTNTEEWLQKRKLAGYEAKEKNKKVITILDIQNILSELLEIPNLRIEANSEKASFYIEEKEFTLSELSEGYKSIIIFVIDLIARITKDNPEWTKTQDFKAVVLVDELDLFLHPTWEKEICNKLSSWFPDIQFFITTHSPVLVLGAPKDKTVIFKLTNENNQTVIKERYDGKDIENWLPNILISSPLFGTNFLDKKSDEQIMKVPTEDNFPKMEENKRKIDILKEKEKAEKFYLENLGVFHK